MPSTRLGLLILALILSPDLGHGADGVLDRFGNPKTPAFPAGSPDSLEPFPGKFALRESEVVVFAGQENMVRKQKAGELEWRLTSAHAAMAPRFLSMAWEGDTVYEQRRELNFGSWDAQLKALGAGVVIAQFGQIEALDGLARIPDFTAAYSRLLDVFGLQTKRLVLISPMPFERPVPLQAPDLTSRNPEVRAYAEAVRQIARQRDAIFVDVYGPLEKRALTQAPRLTERDGMHLTRAGLETVARIVAEQLESAGRDSVDREALRRAIVEKNRLWFDSWRPMNWAFAYGDRTTQLFGQPAGGRPWLKEELEGFKSLIAAEESTIHLLAQGKSLPQSADKSNPPIVSPTTTPIRAHEQDPAKALEAMQVAAGYTVNLYAGESHGVVNPIQIAWDERGRLYAACSPTYPHIIPGQQPADYILVCEDRDGDGTADHFERFAEGLFMVQGVEPGDGGVYVCAGTELLHFRDLDGDGRADERTLVLSGFGTGDAHQLINSISRGPDGAFWFTQGLHVNSCIETPWGLSRVEKSAVWRWHPRTLRLDGFFNGGKAGHNDWGVAFDDFNQGFHKTGDRPHGYYLTPGLMRLSDPEEYHPVGALFETPIKTTALDFIGTKHLPETLQGCAVIAGFMGHTVEIYRMLDDGSGFRSEKLPDLVRSSDRAFRPVDVSVGPDGAIYVCDFHNPLIGHYQTSYRDPGRDHGHGRVWRVAAAGRDPVRQPKLASMKPAELLDQLGSSERWTRYQAKRLLFDAPTPEVIRAADVMLERLKATNHVTVRLRLEIAGVYQAHGTPRSALVQSLVTSDDARVRAYGTRLAGAWGAAIPDAAAWLANSAVDPNARVRLEALVASMELPADQAFQRFMDVAGKPRDRFIDYALVNAARVLRPYWQPLAASDQWGVPLEVRNMLERSAGRAKAERHPGQVVYDRLCLNCHQPEGKGLANIYPPIVGSPSVAGDPDLLIRMLLHGLKGPMKRNGTVYNNIMPPSGLNDDQVADVLSYLRSHFGHQAAPVSAAEVTEVRTRYAGRTAPWEASALEVSGD